MGGERRRRWVGTRERHKCLKEALSDEMFSNGCAYVITFALATER